MCTVSWPSEAAVVVVVVIVVVVVAAAVVAVVACLYDSNSDYDVDEDVN